jgi:hypothetical protein
MIAPVKVLHLLHRLRRPNLPLLASLGMVAASLALAWAVRAAPRAVPPLLLADALGAFFVFATFFALALLAAATPPGEQRISWRAAAAALATVVAYLSPWVPLVMVAFVLLAALVALPRGRPFRLVDALPLVAAALLAVGYGTLVARGVLRYDDRAAGAALDGFVFWFVVLAAVTPLLPFARTSAEGERWLAVFRLAWLYPLARLYSLGPWNDGWSLATLLFGGALALWAGTAAVGAEDRARCRELLVLAQLALALAGFGLGTGAGLAAGCYALLVYGLLLSAGRADASKEPEGSTDDTPLPWLLTPAVPFGAPFVAVWMLLGAGVAGGVSLLGAAAWLVGLSSAVACLLWRPWDGVQHTVRVTAISSLVLGVLAPVVVLALVQPAVEQLQGGLSVYGDVAIWPWVGLAAVDSARRGVTALPSIAVAALMLVLGALVYFAARLLYEAEPQVDETDALPAGRSQALLAALRHEVPWLAARRGEERRSDDR